MLKPHGFTIKERKWLQRDVMGLRSYILTLKKEELA